MRHLVRFNPHNSIFSMKKEMDRICNRFEEGAPTRTGAYRPATDIYETENELVLRLEIPGVKKEDVKISIENNILSLNGERKMNDDIDREDYHRVESNYGSFYRSFTLPSRINSEMISAEYEDGILQIVMPKKEESKPREIEVKVN